MHAPRQQGPHPVHCSLPRLDHHSPTHLRLCKAQPFLHCRQCDSSGPEQRAQGPKQAVGVQREHEDREAIPTHSAQCPPPGQPTQLPTTYLNTPGGWRSARPRSSPGHTGHRPRLRSRHGSRSAHCPHESLRLRTAHSRHKASRHPLGRLWVTARQVRQERHPRPSLSRMWLWGNCYPLVLD